MLDCSSSYRHGKISTHIASADKNCYYSAPFDMVFSLIKKFRISNWDDVISIPLFFSVYTNGTPLYVQTVESLLLQRYLGKPFKGSQEVEESEVYKHYKNILPVWAYILTTQMAFEKHKETDKYGNPKVTSKTGATTMNRTIVTTPAMYLPHLDNDSLQRFRPMLEGLKGVIQSVWLEYDKRMTKATNSFIGEEHWSVLSKICTEAVKSLKDLKNIGEFTAVCLIQFLGGLEILPPSCNYFGYVCADMGPYHFFQNCYPEKKSMNKKKQLEEYNRELLEIALLCQKNLNTYCTMMEVENMCCEHSRMKRERDKRKVDVKYCYKFRSNVRRDGDKGDGSFVGGYQNFFFLRFDEKDKVPRLHMLVARNASSFGFVPVSRFIQICGREGRVDFKDDNNWGLPFNLVNLERGTIRFHNESATPSEMNMFTEELSSKKKYRLKIVHKSKEGSTKRKKM